MKQIINSKHLSTLIFILSIIVLLKVLWVTATLLFLPKSGVEFQESAKLKKLYYRVRLTNNAQAIAPVKPKTVPKSNQVSSMRGYKLLGLYHSSKTLVVTVEKNRKTTILSKGEATKDGFKLISAGSNYALFEKNKEQFKLTLLSTKSSTSTKTSTVPRESTPSVTKENTTNQIIDDGDVKRIPKQLLTSYTKDMDKIWKDVGLAQYKKNGQPYGFKINFVKKGSDMEKLGLKRGDILKAVNAEPLNLSTAMGFFNNINTMDNLTLTIERNGQSEDMEYEIQ
jgi:general secretion pathway protein C